MIAYQFEVISYIQSFNIQVKMALLGFQFLLSCTLVLNLIVNGVEGNKIDCHPLPGATKQKCESLGCIWSPVEESGLKETTHKLPFDVEVSMKIMNQRTSSPRSIVNEPWCYFPDDYQGYQITKLDSSGGRAELTRKRGSGVPNDIEKLVVEITPLLEADGSPLNVKIFDPNTKRFEPELPAMITSGFSSKNLLSFSITQEGLLTVVRSATGAIIFQTHLGKLIYTNQFIQLNTKIDSPFVYGLGEHYDTFLKKADAFRAYSLFHMDMTPQPEGRRTYGAFPFFVNLDSNQQTANGVYLRSSNGMDVIIQSDQSVTFRSIGGILNFYILSGPEPNDVARQFQNLVGLPSLPPRWALGFHLCRYDYKTLDKTKQAFQRTRDSGIPFDVQWNDIDYMLNHDDFSYDKVKFAGLPDFVKMLHDSNMHYMLIFDPGLSREDSYYPYKLGKELDIFIKNATNQELVGKVWNDSGRTVFPDFSNPKSIEFWRQLFEKFHKEIQFDGAWLDMNDISNFVEGSIDGCPSWDPSENPPYLPGGNKLQERTLCMSAQHQAGKEYDVHNLYSFYESIATYAALETARPGKRPLIISRSTSPGQGKYSGHWSGDVLSSWDYLKWSIPAQLEHSIYGFPMMGTDICGFVGDTNPELCARWSTLGAFYTFSRNHNDDKSIDQDPVALGPDVVEANRNALRKKYSLIPYLYSLMYRAHLYGEPVVRAVPFEYHATDPESLNVEYQMMWGRGFLISPIVDPSTFSKSTYLPVGRWYETNVLPCADCKFKVPKLIDSQGVWHNTDEVGLTDIPLFYRGGYIFPTYVNVKQTVPETANQAYSLEVALCKMGRARGELFDDDGDSVDGRYNHVTIVFSDNTLTINLDHNDFSPTTSFGQVLIYGIKFDLASVELDGEQLPFNKKNHTVWFDLNGRRVEKNKPLAAKLNPRLSVDL